MPPQDNQQQNQPQTDFQQSIYPTPASSPGNDTPAKQLQPKENKFRNSKLLIAVIVVLILVAGLALYKVLANKNSVTNGSSFYKLQTISLGGQNLSYMFDPSQKVTTPQGVSPSGATVTPTGVFVDIGGKDLLHRAMAIEIGVYANSLNKNTKCTDDLYQETFSVHIYGIDVPVCSHHQTYSDHPDMFIYFIKNNVFYKAQFISSKTYPLDNNTVKIIAGSFQ